MKFFQDLFKSKKFKEFIIGIIAMVAVNKLGMEPEAAAQLSESILYLTGILIGAQGIADMGAAGRTSGNFTK